MTTLQLASYDCFSAEPFGGNIAFMIAGAAALDESRMKRIAREFGVPATCFIQEIAKDGVRARFFAPGAELPMCGHGTMGLYTWLFEEGHLTWGDAERMTSSLTTPLRTAPVALTRQPDGRPLVMLDLNLPAFTASDVDADRLAGLLGCTPAAFDIALPLETATADFVHLVVALTSLDDLLALQLDFGGLAALCRQHGIGTVICWTRETRDAASAWHCRDFCPALGVDEAPAVGTSNGALAAYLVRHGVIAGGGVHAVEAEQGIAVGRPSRIHLEIDVEDSHARTIRVGGMATRMISGAIPVPA